MEEWSAPRFERRGVEQEGIPQKPLGTRKWRPAALLIGW